MKVTHYFFLSRQIYFLETQINNVFQLELNKQKIKEVKVEIES